jgi:ribosomal protein L30/L7E
MSAETQKVDVLGIRVKALIDFHSEQVRTERMLGIVKRQHDHAGMLNLCQHLIELVDAAKEASGTLGHAYHTTLTGELAEDAHKAYQRLDAALARIGSAA